MPNRQAPNGELFASTKITLQQYTNGEAAKILGDKERELREIDSVAYKTIQTIRGDADARATEIYAAAYNKNAESIKLYEFIKSMETYRTILDPNTTLILSTESDLFKFLKDMDGGSAP